ncbi:hypothetical protein [Dechloromonas denitrificans]|uniref:hypothetical protein n=1 Tax=Dechloromonas denitrificans TaxID=281362 RepID=UPI001CF82489|nr:hypothetical protein [Dechloromonas denitrificans]UCV05660.1 hypothetical protein KI611_10585 [Dechloromonas denitrificans]
MTEDSATLSYPFPVARRIKGMSGTAHEDLRTWPTVFEPALGTNVSRYLKRKRAVIEYLSGASDASLKRQYGIGMKGVYRLIRRCLEAHHDGQIYGWRGLVPYARQEPYTRTKVITVNGAGKGAAGALTTVLALEGDLGERFNKRILKAPSDDKLEEKRNRTAHWRWLLGELRKKGYEIRHEWPFNTENMGYVSVCRYVKAVLAANPTQGAMIEGGKDAQKKLKSSDGVERPVEHLLQRVEMDAHKTDGRFCVLFPRGDGSYAAKIVHRLWVIVLLEVVSRAVLGYYLSFRYEVSKDDVLRAIKRALTKWQRRSIAFGDEAYYEEAALPSGHNDRYIGMCWDETSVDGALAETSIHVRQVLDDIVGSRLLDPKTSFAVRRSMDDRPFVETFFRRLGAGGFQRLTNTTGGNPKGKKGRDPEAVAVNSRFQVEYAEDMLDILIANYNATEHPSLGGRSPLEYLDFLSSRPGAPDLRYADSSEVQRILSYRKLCTVLGNLAIGRRPYVNFAGASHHGDALQQRFDLVGKKIWVENHIEYDARVALAYTVEGESLGVLRAAPPWHKTPHSLEVRSGITAFFRRKRISTLALGDAIQAFHRYCEEYQGKLPVHPAYLESLRVLAMYAEADVGASVLDAALAEAEGGAEQPSTDSAKRTKEPSGQPLLVPDQVPNLPSRRKAATK